MALSVVEIEKLVRPYLDQEDYVLCEIKVLGNPRKPHIRIFIDRIESFLKVDDCVKVTREIMDLLDVHPKVPENYRLEVSSPGLDFPMSELWQFKKNVDKQIAWESSKPDVVEAFHEIPENRGLKKVHGKILDVHESEKSVLLEVSEKQFELDLDEVTGAVIYLNSPLKRKKSKRK